MRCTATRKLPLSAHQGRVDASAQVGQRRKYLDIWGYTHAFEPLPIEHLDVIDRDLNRAAVWERK
jgi:hypothetical protein